MRSAAHVPKGHREAAGVDLDALQFFLVAVGYKVPWTAISSLLSQLKAHYGEPRVLLWLNLAYFLPSVPALLVHSSLQDGLEARLGVARAAAARFAVGLGSLAALCLAFPHMASSLPHLLATTAAVGVAYSVAFGTSHQLAPRFSPGCTVALTTGFVSCGAVVLAADLLLHAHAAPIASAAVGRLFQAMALQVLVGLASALLLLRRHGWRLRAGSAGKQGGAHVVALLPHTHAGPGLLALSSGRGGGASGHVALPRSGWEAPGGGASRHGAHHPQQAAASMRPAGDAACAAAGVYGSMQSGYAAGGYGQHQQQQQQQLGWYGGYGGYGAAPPSAPAAAPGAFGMHAPYGAVAGSSASGGSSGHGHATPVYAGFTTSAVTRSAHSSSSHWSAAAPPGHQPHALPQAAGADGAGGGGGGYARGCWGGDAAAAAVDDAGDKQRRPPLAGGGAVGVLGALRRRAAPLLLLARIAWRIWPAAAALSLSVGSSMLVFPLFTYVGTDGPLGEHLPQVLFYARLLGDIAGRLVPPRWQLASPRALLMAAFLKTKLLLLLVPALLNAGLVGGDAPLVLLVSLNWFLSGFVNTGAYLLAPQLVTRSGASSGSSGHSSGRAGSRLGFMGGRPRGSRGSSGRCGPAGGAGYLGGGGGGGHSSGSAGSSKWGGAAGADAADASQLRAKAGGLMAFCFQAACFLGLLCACALQFMLHNRDHPYTVAAASTLSAASAATSVLKHAAITAVRQSAGMGGAGRSTTAAAAAAAAAAGLEVGVAPGGAAAAAAGVPLLQTVVSAFNATRAAAVAAAAASAARQQGGDVAAVAGAAAAAAVAAGSPQAAQ